VVRDLDLSPAAFGLTITGYGLGTVVGSIFAARLGHGTNVARILVLAVLLTGFPLIAAAAIDNFAAIVGLVALSGVGEAALVIVYVSVRAANSPEALVGRIASTARVFALGLMPFGNLAGGLLIDHIGGSETLAVLGIALCILGLAFTQIRGLRSASLAPVHATPPIADTGSLEGITES
jgi:MFS family permease